MPRRKGDDLDDFIVPDDEVEESEDSEVESLCEKESSSEEDEAPRRRRAALAPRREDSSSSSEDDSDDDGIPAGYLYCALCAKPVVADSFSANKRSCTTPARKRIACSIPRATTASTSNSSNSRRREIMTATTNAR